MATKTASTLPKALEKAIADVKAREAALRELGDDSAEEIKTLVRRRHEIDQSVRYDGSANLHALEVENRAATSRIEELRAIDESLEERRGVHREGLMLARERREELARAHILDTNPNHFAEYEAELLGIAKRIQVDEADIRSLATELGVAPPLEARYRVNALVSAAALLGGDVLVDVRTYCMQHGIA